MLEPFNRFILGNTMWRSNPSLSTTTLCNTSASTSKNDIKIHPINSNWRIIFYAQINVFLNSKTKIASIRKVLPVEFKFFDLNFLYKQAKHSKYLQTTINNLLSFWTTHSAMNSNFLITANPKSPDSITSLGQNRCLTS